jgi:hypothetical protein
MRDAGDRITAFVTATNSFPAPRIHHPASSALLKSSFSRITYALMLPCSPLETRRLLWHI